MPTEESILWRSFKVILSKWIDDISCAIGSKDISDLNTIRNEMLMLRGDYNE